MATSKTVSFSVLITICTIFLATLIPISNAQNSPDDFVYAHNLARAQVGVGPVSWDTNLEAYAQSYADSRASADCGLIHSGGPYGENLAWGTFVTGIDAVNMWVNENTDYDYNSNTCAPDKVCGHYTQVVWSDSVSIGCARVPCFNNGDNYFVICSYAPPGNFIGQRPY